MAEAATSRYLLWPGYLSTAAYGGRVLPQGHAVWTIDGGTTDTTPRELTDTTPRELDTAQASDGSRKWRYAFPATRYRLQTAC